MFFNRHTKPHFQSVALKKLEKSFQPGDVSHGGDDPELDFGVVLVLTVDFKQRLDDVSLGPGSFLPPRKKA